jgi:hypothetical protein
MLKMKKILKKAVPFLAIVAIAAMMFALPAMASNGNLVFYHGVDPGKTTTFGGTSSTAIENSIGHSAKIIITGGQMQLGTHNFPTTTNYLSSGWTLEINVLKSRGSSEFGYYVDGTLRHTSTAPWNFDFT